MIIDPRIGDQIFQKESKLRYMRFFNADTIKVLKKYDLSGKDIGQFCCNNGRELLSLVKTVAAKSGVGFDIAENMIEFVNKKASELDIPCEFVAQNILDIGDEYRERFDVVIITIGALCWFQDLGDYFAVVARCMGFILPICRNLTMISVKALVIWMAKDFH